MDEQSLSLVQRPTTPIAIVAPRIMSMVEIEALKEICKVAAYSGFLSSNAPMSDMARRVADAFFVASYGHELGVSTMTSLRQIYVIDGKLATSGQLMLSLVRRGGVDVMIPDPANITNIATVALRRPGSDWREYSFTQAMAEKAGLWGKNTWAKYPSQMMIWRAVSIGCRFEASDIAGGLHTVEELSPETPVDEDGAPTGPIVVSVVTKPSEQPAATPPIIVETPVTTPATPATPAVSSTNTTGDDEKKPDPADWTKTTDWPKFLEWLAARKRNGQPAALTDAEALSLVGAPNWFPTYPTIKAAAEAVAHELDKPAPEQPAQPKNPPKPTTSVPSGWTNESWTQLVDLCARDYNMTTDEMAKLLEVGNLRTVYPALPAAEVAIRNAAEKRQVPMCCYQATYHEVQSKKVVDLLGPNKALFRVFGGRENLTKLLGGADGKQFASENGLEAWELNKTYDIDGIRVSWQAEGRSNRKVLGLSLRVPYPPTDSESAAEDNVPTPPWEPPPGEGENLDDWFDDKKEEVLERTIST